ncbi:MAG: mismatch repair protein MutL [Chloroflexota bacterium]|nr:mismatch repair protein MutL [Chloroflexota bacterium]
MTIKILSQNVAAKIAAGEVVERPLSVVKELMENAIDAGASEIKIRVESGGQRLIQVEDNGIGIASDEAAVALQRYATSKITQVEDLEHIQTLGFRGEALASIAAVSRFTLDSQTEQEKMGVHLSVEGGDILAQEPAGLSQGTRIKAEDLFFNVPARRKFLKSENTERKAISDLISRYALYYADIRFQFTMEGRQVLNTNGSGERREVLSQLYDVNTARDLLDLKVVDEYLGVEGFLSPVGISRSNRREIFFFINGRLVSDSALTAAVTRAYQNMLMVGRFPIAAVFLKIDPQEVDVNVHPTKAEVRFRDAGRIFGLLNSAVRKHISAFSNVPNISPTFWNSGSSQPRDVDPAWQFAGEVNRDLAPQAGAAPMGEAPAQPGEAALLHVPLLRLVGQIGRTYIVAEGPDGLYLIDQHAAHERVLFERLLKQHASSESQYLLEPEVVQVPGTMDADLAPQIEVLNHLGFKIENFGPSTYKIKALPVVISKSDPREAFLSALEVDEENDGSWLEGEQENKLISRICKRIAIKGGQTLSTEEQEQLIRELEQCESPRTCPHGRPTMIHLSVDMLERQFGRRGAR